MENNNNNNFSDESSAIKLQLQEMIEKTKQIEAQLLQEIRSQTSTVDFFKPDSSSNEPPKKRRKV